MKHFRLNVLIASAFLAAGLAACSPQDSAKPPAGPAITAAQAIDTLSAEGKGFTVGATMAARTVYVLFDPQCPHCGHLWQAAQPLLGKVRFVWMPVAFLGPKSLPQGAALLQAAQPLEAMNAHEQSLLSGGGGTAASSSIPADIEAAIKSNTSLLNRLGAESVPYIVTKSPNGQPVLHAGAMDTPELVTLLGLQ